MGAQMLYCVAAHALLFLSETDGCALAGRGVTASKPRAKGEQLNHV
jgi:hypothetical protein